MAAPIVVVAAPFLLRQREAWGEGYTLVEPVDVAPGGAAAAAADSVEVIVSGGDPLDKRLVESLPRLQLVACFTTGYAGIDLRHLRARGVALTTAAGVNAHDVADHAIA